MLKIFRFGAELSEGDVSIGISGSADRVSKSSDWELSRLGPQPISSSQGSRVIVSVKERDLEFMVKGPEHNEGDATGSPEKYMD